MKLCFNSSLPRSGSTLLQNILAQNTSIYCSPTSGTAEMLDGAKKVFTESPLFKLQPGQQSPEHLAGFCRGALEGYYNAVTNAEWIVDKSRAWMYYFEWLEQIMGDAPKMFICVRDIRAILSSMEKLHRKNAHLTDPAANPAAMQFLTVDQRVQSWMTSPPVGLSLGCLSDFIHKGHDQKVHFMIYEKLVANPEAEIYALYDFLGIEPFKHTFDRVSQLVEENDAVHGVYGDHQVRAVVEPVKRDWNDILGKDVAAAAVQRNQWFYERFYPKD